MRFSRSWIVVATSPSIVLVFCGGILGCSNCKEDHLTARLPANVTINGNTQSVVFQEDVTRNVMTFSEFRATIRDAGGAGAAPGWIGWSMGLSLNNRWLFLALDTPVQSGEIISIQARSPTFYWEVVEQEYFSSSSRAYADMQFDTFHPATVTGSLTVRDTTPLQLRVDLTFRNAAADSTLRVEGDVAFRDYTVKVPCVQ